jgi:hypothetical protein
MCGFIASDLVTTLVTVVVPIFMPDMSFELLLGFMESKLNQKPENVRGLLLLRITWRDRKQLRALENMSENNKDSGYLCLFRLVHAGIFSLWSDL